MKKLKRNSLIKELSKKKFRPISKLILLGILISFGISASAEPEKTDAELEALYECYKFVDKLGIDNDEANKSGYGCESTPEEKRKGIERGLRYSAEKEREERKARGK